MANPNVGVMHLTKLQTPLATVAVCGRSVHSHRSCKDAVLVTCANCLKQLKKDCNNG